MTNVKNCHDIIKAYLDANGYDGLYNPGECACLKDDLESCENIHLQECEPGYRRPATEEDGSEFDWVIGKDRPIPERKENKNEL